MESQLPVVLFLLIILGTFSVLSLDTEGAKEKRCFTPDKSRLAGFDVNWLLSMNKMYYSYMSRLDLYITSSDQVGLEPKDLAENTVYYKGCITWKPEPDAGGYLQDGLGIEGKKYLLSFPDPETGAFPYSNSDGGYNGLSYTTLTDNRTYLVALNCYTDWDQMTWSVSTSIKKLPKKTITLIHDHVQSWGFKREQFTSLRFDRCKYMNTSTTYGLPKPNNGK